MNKKGFKNSMVHNLKLLIYKWLFPSVYNTLNYLHPISFRYWFKYFVLQKNNSIYWPIHPTSLVINPRNIEIGIDSCPGYSPGCYIQGTGKVIIGNHTGLAPNVGIISANHAITDYSIHIKEVVKIGSYCWIGMNSTILPGVTLGDHTIVRAGSVVVDSFPDGYCVIGGNPAILIKQFPEKAKHLFNKPKHEKDYIGFFPKEIFLSKKFNYVNER